MLVRHIEPQCPCLNFAGSAHRQIVSTTTAEPISPATLQYTMAARALNTGYCCLYAVRACSATLHPEAYGRGECPTLTISPFAAEHRASNGWKRADMSRFWTIAVTGVRFPARTCKVRVTTHFTSPFATAQLCYGFDSVRGGGKYREDFESGEVPEKGVSQRACHMPRDHHKQGCCIVQGLLKGQQAWQG